MILHYSSQTKKPRFSPRSLWGIGSIVGIVALLWLLQNVQEGLKHRRNLGFTDYFPPLVMSDGDPYIRALMRTISASESNGKNSYALLYGGSHIHDLSQHPNQCIPIRTNVNQGKCSTAAGRYQFLTSTWLERAGQYHPAPSMADGHTNYSFEPKYQDTVVYQWLKDHSQWGIDVLSLLKEDRVEEVLTHLSGVWTSLGGGIEDNLNTPRLPALYRKFLKEEFKVASKPVPEITNPAAVSSPPLNSNDSLAFQSATQPKHSAL